MNEQQIRKIIRDELKSLLLSDRFMFEKLIQIADGRGVQLGITTGSKFGTQSTQKIGFLNATPVSQQAKINDPSGGATIDSQSRTAINAIIDALEAFGFTSTT